MVMLGSHPTRCHLIHLLRGHLRDGTAAAHKGLEPLHLLEFGHLDEIACRAALVVHGNLLMLGDLRCRLKSAMKSEVGTSRVALVYYTRSAGASAHRARCDATRRPGRRIGPRPAEPRNGVGRSGSLVADEQVRALCANSWVRFATTALRQHETTSNEATRVQTRSARLRDLRSGWEAEGPMLAVVSRKRPVTARAAYLDAALSGGSLGRPASAQVQSAT